MSFAIYRRLIRCFICDGELQKHPSTTATDAGAKYCSKDGDFLVVIDLQDNPSVMYRKSKNDKMRDVTRYYGNGKKATRKVEKKKELSDTGLPQWPNATRGRPRGAGRVVQCVETGEIYRTITVAAEALGVERTGISKILAGKRHSVGGFRFIYISG